MNGDLCHSGQDRSDLEGLGAGAGQKKSGNGRSGSTGIRQASEVALFATQLDWLMTREPGRWS